MLKKLAQKLSKAFFQLFTKTPEAADSSADAVVDVINLCATQNVFGKTASFAAESIAAIDGATDLLKEKNQITCNKKPKTFIQAFFDTLKVTPRELINKSIDKNLVKFSKSLYDKTDKIYHNITNIQENPLEKIHQSTQDIIDFSNDAATQGALFVSRIHGGVEPGSFKEFYKKDPEKIEALEQSSEYAEKGLGIIASTCNPLSVIGQATNVANKIVIATKSMQEDAASQKGVDAQQKLNQSGDQASKALGEFVVDTEKLLNKVEIESKSTFEKGLNFFQNLINSSQKREDEVRGR